MPRKLRVLFVFQSLEIRGAQRVALNLIAHLDRRKFEPVMWVLKPESDLQGEVPPDVPVHTALLVNQRLRQRLPEVWRSLLREARRADVIVPTVEFTPTHLAYLAGLLTGRPVIGWVHTNFDQVLAEYPHWDNGLPRWVYRHLRRTVCVSQGSRVILRNRYGLRDDRLCVIYNPLNVRLIERQWALPLSEWASFMTERPTVLAVGHLGYVKGFDLLIEAHARLRARGIDHDLLILGQGDDLEALRALAERLGVAQSVHLPGYVSNPYTFMRHATVFALSSRYEGFALVVTEAMACGVPVVAFDCPSGPGEILEGGRHGLLVPPEDVSALADGLADVLTNPGLAERLRQSGLRRAQDFEPEQILPQWEHLLQEAVGSRRPALRPAPLPRPEEGSSPPRG